MQTETSKMELEIPSAEEPVSCIINVTRLFRLGQRELKCMYLGLTTLREIN